MPSAVTFRLKLYATARLRDSLSMAICPEGVGLRQVLVSTVLVESDASKALSSSYLASCLLTPLHLV